MRRVTRKTRAVQWPVLMCGLVLSAYRNELSPAWVLGNTFKIIRLKIPVPQPNSTSEKKSAAATTKHKQQAPFPRESAWTRAQNNGQVYINFQFFTGVVSRYGIEYRGHEGHFHSFAHSPFGYIRRLHWSLFLQIHQEERDLLGIYAREHKVAFNIAVCLKNEHKS